MSNDPKTCPHLRVVPENWNYDFCLDCNTTVRTEGPSAEEVVAALEPGIRAAAKEVWARHPNNPINKGKVA